MIKLNIYTSIVVLVLSWATVQSQESLTQLIIEVEPKPNFLNQMELEINYVANQNSKKLKIPNKDQIIVSQEIPQNDLFLNFSVNIENLPEHYKFYPFNLKVPYTERKRSNVISICPIRIDKNLGQIPRIIWNTNVSNLSLRKKFQFFQTTAAVFLERRKLLANDWTKLNSKDVQVAFKHLEVVRELSKIGFLTSNNHIEEVTSWFEDAIANNSSRVSKTLNGLNSANQMIKQIKSIKGLEFSKVWKKASRIESGKEKYSRMKMVVEYHNSLPSNELRKNVLEISRITESSMINDLAAAFNFIVKRIDDETYFANEINYIISKIDHALEIDDDSRFRNQLKKNRDYFNNLKLSRLGSL